MLLTCAPISGLPSKYQEFIDNLDLNSSRIFIWIRINLDFWQGSKSGRKKKIMFFGTTTLLLRHELVIYILLLTKKIYRSLYSCCLYSFCYKKSCCYIILLAWYIRTSLVNRITLKLKGEINRINIYSSELDSSAFALRILNDERDRRYAYTWLSNCHINHNSNGVKYALIAYGGGAKYTMSLFWPPYWSRVKYFFYLEWKL